MQEKATAAHLIYFEEPLLTVHYDYPLILSGDAEKLDELKKVLYQDAVHSSLGNCLYFSHFKFVKVTII